MAYFCWLSLLCGMYGCSVCQCVCVCVCVCVLLVVNLLFFFAIFLSVNIYGMEKENKIKRTQRHRIQLAIALSKETSRALGTVWGMAFYPLVPFMFFGMYLIYWGITGVYMASVADLVSKDMPAGIETPYYTNGPTLKESLGLQSVTNPVYKYYEIVTEWQYAVLFHFFVLLWVVQFIAYHTYMVVGGVYAEWYFAEWTPDLKHKKRGNHPTELGNHPIWESFWRYGFAFFFVFAFFYGLLHGQNKKIKIKKIKKQKRTEQANITQGR